MPTTFVPAQSQSTLLDFALSKRLAAGLDRNAAGIISR